MLTEEHRTEEMQSWKTAAGGKCFPTILSTYCSANGFISLFYSVGEDKVNNCNLSGAEGSYFLCCQDFLFLSLDASCSGM